MPLSTILLPIKCVSMGNVYGGIVGQISLW